MQPIRYALLLLFCGVLGCAPAKGSVSGTVTLDGKPLDNAAVTFHSSGTGPTAYGTTVSSGSYVLQTGAREEVPPGDYLVTVVATEEVSRALDAKSPPQPPKVITPQRYADKSTSGLNFTVKPGSNRFDIEMRSR